MALHIVSVDFQNEFAAEGGALYSPRPSVPFICDTLVPFMRTHRHKIVEIVSDYRSTKAGGSSSCVPGQWGFESLIPDDVKHPSVWVKAMPSPSWVREGAGQADQKPGAPYPDPVAFSTWLKATIGAPAAGQTIVLIGLMLEICVLSTLQELKYRGYSVKVLSEGTDTYLGSDGQKQEFFGTIFPFWGAVIDWQGVQKGFSDS